jgi:hypothetical protein
MPVSLLRQLDPSNKRAAWEAAAGWEPAGSLPHHTLR